MKAQQAQSYDIPLHDIKTIVDVTEYSLYYLLGVSSVVLIVLFLGLYLLYMWYKKRNAFNIKKEHYRLLHELDLSDTKHSAYAITSYGLTFKDDSPRHQEMYTNITNRLEVYKYKKHVDKFDSETLGYIELYKGMIDV
ncbi:hypothetical protein [Candidatus Sulfurimonas baltica]|uniref:DUF4381 domain-containing protein n=1 Tax=Candidatus Sulfurimonas baltica TaxID=2740404 RepID=A0A7S7LT65_9BACT|nr:hypothetical protein [Candidatus Sulfurimonas baltica]QOY50873.1 hypothetical protein HUE88_09200 [Candidatus Sulfurimonas baltica]